MKWGEAITKEEEKIKEGTVTPTTAPEDVKVAGPTTDEDLERMKQDYLGGPAQVKAFAQALGARTPEEEKRVVNESLPHFAKLHVAFEKAGITFQTNDSGVHAGVVDSDDSGNITFTLNRHLLGDRIRASSLSPKSEINLLGSEEFNHAADLASLSTLWKRENPGATSGFSAWWKNKLGLEIGDMRGAIANAPAQDRTALYQGIGDILHTYFGSVRTEEGQGFRADDSIFDIILNDPKIGGWRFAAEMARMVVQQRNQGAISEDTYRNLYQRISDYFNKVLKRVRDAFPRAEQGAYGPLMQQHVERIQDQIAQWKAQAKLQGEEEPFPRLSPEDIATATSEKPLPAYKPRPPPKKPLKQAMAEMYGAVKQATIGGQKKETREQMVERLRSQGMMSRPQEGEKPKASFAERMRRLGLLPGQGVAFRPAVQVGGKTYEGVSHFDAVRNAKRQGLSNQEILKGTVGNLDETGKFKPFETREQGLATREGAATVNVGMATDDGKGLSLEEILKALEETGAGVRGYRVAPSATEPTVVAYLNKTLEPDEAYKLSKDLRQQAIAEKFEGGADLYGPGAEAWRPFNEDFFLASRAQAPELARSVDELEQMAKDFKQYRLWYEEFDKFLDSILGANSEYKPLITDFVAATSPGTEIGPNMRQAVDKLRQFLEEGTVTYHGLGHWPGAKLPNLRRAMEGIESLHGPKVNPFSEALKGNPNAAAVDRHVAMILFNTRKPTDAQIKVGQKAAIDIAQRLGWTPRQVQAAWWAAGKELFGERGKLVETYEQYLKEYQDELNSILTKKTGRSSKRLTSCSRLSESWPGGRR
jgi:hypothetical protein